MAARSSKINIHIWIKKGLQQSTGQEKQRKWRLGLQQSMGQENTEKWWQGQQQSMAQVIERRMVSRSAKINGSRKNTEKWKPGLQQSMVQGRKMVVRSTEEYVKGFYAAY